MPFLDLRWYKKYGRKTKRGSSKFPKTRENDRALHYHCAFHELNLALTEASRVPEVFNMVCLLQSLGWFFASSPKRQRLFEKVIQEKVDQSTFNKMKMKPYVKHSKIWTSYTCTLFYV